MFRAGCGLTYAYTENAAGATVTTNGAYPIAPGINQFVNETAPGFIQQPTWPVTAVDRYPLLGTNTGSPYMPDANENRPSRTNQFSAGFQRDYPQLRDGSHLRRQPRGVAPGLLRRWWFSPSTTSPQNPISRNSLGYITSGFGTMSSYTAPGTAGAFTGRTGTLLMKFSF